MTIDKLKINEDIYKLGNDAIIEGYYRRYPTLSTPPTLQTLTYTLDGETLTYDIGAVVRVEDAGSQTGYSFYRLHDITDLGGAIWSKLGNGLLELYETLTVDVISNQGVVDSNLVGVQVVVKYGNTSLTQTYAGEPMMFYIPAGSSYHIHAVNNVPSGYGVDYSSSNYTAVSWGARRLEVTCGVEVVSITVDGFPVQIDTDYPIINNYSSGTSTSDVSIPGSLITIDGQSYPLESKMDSSTNTVSVPLNSVYTVFISGFEFQDSGNYQRKFATQSSTYTATQQSRTINIVANDPDDGIYILRNNGEFYEPSYWDTDWNDDAVGIAIVHEVDRDLFPSFVIKKDDDSVECAFDSLIADRINGEDLIPSSSYYNNSSYSAEDAIVATSVDYNWSIMPTRTFFTETTYQNSNYRPNAQYDIEDCVEILTTSPNTKFAVELADQATGSNVSSTNWDARVYQGYEAIRNCTLKDVTLVNGVMYGTPRYLQIGNYISAGFPYIGTMAQWQYLRDNKTAVDDAMDLIGGTSILDPYGSEFPWTMTPVYQSGYHMWDHNYSFGNINLNNRTEKTYTGSFVRPFYHI